MPILHSKIIGDGPALCILHGFLGMSDNWKTLGNEYAKKGFQVHLIDQRNHGHSFHSDDFNYDILAADLKAYLEHHHITSTAIIGHSMGGKTAMQFACNFPDIVEKLIIADIAPKYYPPHHQDIINALNSLDLEHISSRGEAEEELSKHITDFGTRQFLLKNLYWVEKGKLGFRMNLPVLSNKMEEVGEDINPGSVFTKPTLFLRGSKSSYILDIDIPEIKKHFPEALIDTIDNAGHWVHAENRKQFFEKSIDFLI